ncbi:VanZ family protein [Streptomyces mirabilis]|uniref:VanZ family protein n=1 Tax=Streptomyces mirabilis TaxID=68239 RepID=UPI003D9EC610
MIQPWYSKKNRRTEPGVTATVMLLVTLVQVTVISGRAFDIDDVIPNTSGVLVGCVCCWAGG